MDDRFEKMQQNEIRRVRIDFREDNAHGGQTRNIHKAKKAYVHIIRVSLYPQRETRKCKQKKIFKDII